MGIWDAITDLVEAAKPWAVAEAEAKPDEPKDDSSDSKTEEEDTAESGEEEEAEGEEEEEEEEEEDEEPVDPKETLEEECKDTPACRPAKHHFDECAERVNSGSKEDCVEEFFHLVHCTTQCAAPKLWSKLK